MAELTISPRETALPFPLLHACALATFLEALIVNSPTAIVALDAKHHFSMANPAFLQLFRYNPEELHSADDFDEMIAVPGTEAEARELSAAVLQGEKVHTVTRRRRSDGTVLEVEIFGIPLMENGRLAGVYGLYQDLTEKTQTQTALRRMSDQVEALQSAERQRANLESNLFSEYEKRSLNLTRRERSLLSMLARGLTNRVIAAQLGISVRTVESHRTNINQKCGFRSVADLVRFVMREEFRKANGS